VIAKKKENYLKELKIMGGKYSKFKYSVKKLSDMLEKKVSKLKIAIIVDGKDEKIFQNIISKVLDLEDEKFNLLNPKEL
jgi:hypothetical protein